MRNRTSGKLYYLLSLLGIFGGVLGYFLIRKKDRKISERILFLGILFSVVYFLIYAIINWYTQDLLEVLDAYCYNETLSVSIASLGIKPIPTLDLKFYLNGSEIAPLACFWLDKIGHNVVCYIETNLTGNVNLVVVGPYNSKSNSVNCS